MTEQHIPWYKNHILILIILIPLATVCGSMYTIYLAVSSKEAPILEDYSKTGLSPQMRQEGRTDITATLADGALTLQRDPPSIEALTLELQHASKAALDQQHTLHADRPNHYPLPAAVQQTLSEATWYLTLAPADRSWKIKGKYPHPKADEPPPPAIIPLANP